MLALRRPLSLSPFMMEMVFDPVFVVYTLFSYGLIVTWLARSGKPTLLGRFTNESSPLYEFLKVGFTLISLMIALILFLVLVNDPGLEFVLFLILSSISIVFSINN